MWQNAGCSYLVYSTRSKKHLTSRGDSATAEKLLCRDQIRGLPCNCMILYKLQIMRKGRLNNSYLCHVGGDRNNANLLPIIPIQRLCLPVTANLSHSQINVYASGDGEFHRPFSIHVLPAMWHYWCSAWFWFRLVPWVGMTFRCCVL